MHRPTPELLKAFLRSTSELHQTSSLHQNYIRYLLYIRTTSDIFSTSEPMKDQTMMFFRVICLCVVTIFILYLQAGDCVEIIGGKEVKPHSLPYMVALRGIACGGMLIHENWVLTAAHCWKDKGVGRPIKIVDLGVHSKQQSSEKFQKKTVKRNFPHPKYNHRTYENDIMLLQLKDPVKQTKTVRIKHLPRPVADMPAGTRCFVAGWGRTAVGVQSDVLQSVNVTVIKRTVCSENYKDKHLITNKMVCAGYINNHPADACKGDSGGPLVCGDELRGVVSFGKGCGDKNFPGVYTFISKYGEWIKETIGKFD